MITPSKQKKFRFDCLLKDITGSKCSVFKARQYIYLHFRSKPLMNLKIFANVHSLMNDTNILTAAKLTSLCNALPTSNSFARNDTGVVNDS